VEKLRDGTQRNGNINRNGRPSNIDCHPPGLPLGSALFDEPTAREIDADLDTLTRFECPEISDAPYDQLAD
jgi:hypothetical protein